MKNGGPAFPDKYEKSGTYPFPYTATGGLTKLEWYAGLALQQVAGELKETHCPAEIAEWCFIMGRAMIAEGEKP